MCQTLRGLTP